MTIKLSSFTLLMLSLLPAGASYAASIVVDDTWVSQHGATISGTYTGTSSTAAISVTTKKPITIQNTAVSGPNNLITLATGSNATVINTRGTGTNPNINGAFKGSFIKGYNVASLLMKNCTVEGVYFGIYLQGFSGNIAAGQTIKILNNVFNNIDGRSSDGNGGYKMAEYTTQPHAHSIQLNAVRGVPGIEIAWNQTIDVPYKSFENDVINIYSSSGTKTSHILVHDNYVQGPMGSSPGNGERYSGGGIITDGKNTDTAATATAYVDIYNNQVTMTGNYGVAVAAGHDNNIYNNRVVSAGFLSNGTYYSMVYANAANNGNLQDQTTSVYYNNHVHDNILGLIRKNASGAKVRSDWWLPGQSDSENNQKFSPTGTTNPTIQDEQNEFTAWQKKLVSNGIVIGVQGGNGTLAITADSGSDSSCTNATDTVYIDGSASGTTFKAGAGMQQTLSSGNHTLALASSNTPVNAGNGTMGTCSGTLSSTQTSITANQTRTITATWKYQAPVLTGTLKINPSSLSDTRCAAASDTLYLDTASSGKSFTVSNGITESLNVGTHQLALASNSTPIPAGGGQSGTCSSTLNPTTINITAGQSAAASATYTYNTVTTATCAVTASIVNSTQLWDVKVDGFHEEVTLTGFPVDAESHITVNGSAIMKNQFKLNFWTNQNFASTINGNTGQFNGKIYSKTGSATFTMDGYLTDGTPINMNTGDFPLKSMTINGIACSNAFPLRTTLH